MKRLLLTAIGVCTTCCLFAQNATTEFYVDGIKVIFKPTVKSVISVRMYYRGGVTNYAAGQDGIENMTLGATSECGTKKYTANQFKDIADQNGISIGGTSDYDSGNITMECISKYFNQGWDLFAEAVTNPVFNAAEVQLLKNKVLARVKLDYSNPDERAKRLLIKNAFEGTPYAVDPDGTEASITALTSKSLKAYYDKLLNKNRMFIVVAGKINKEELIAKIKASFAGLPSKPYKPVTYRAPVWADNKTLTEGRDLATNYINGIMNAPPMSSVDYLPYTIAIDILSGSLWSEIRTRRNLSYTVGATIVDQQMPYTELHVSTTQPKEAVEAMVGQINIAKNFKMPNDGLKEIKNSFITFNYIKLQGSNALTSNLGAAEVLGDWRYFENTAKNLDGVTADQIYNALNKYALGLRWSYLGDLKQAKEAEEAFKMPVNK